MGHHFRLVPQLRGQPRAVAPLGIPATALTALPELPFIVTPVRATPGRLASQATRSWETTHRTLPDSVLTSARRDRRWPREVTLRRRLRQPTRLEHSPRGSFLPPRLQAGHRLLCTESLSLEQGVQNPERSPGSC